MRTYTLHTLCSVHLILVSIADCRVHLAISNNNSQSDKNPIFAAWEKAVFNLKGKKIIVLINYAL